jgi:transcriptional regulator with XRE-family HTH domain
MPPPVENSTTKVAVPEDGIGERIRQARERLRLSQTQFHQRTKEADPEGKGIARTVLIGYESGKFKPGAREIRVLSQAFGLDPEWLVLGEQKKLDDDLDQVRGALLAGINEPGLEQAFVLALSMLCMKQHEREAIATLMHGILSSRRGAPDGSALAVLAGWMANDADDRIRELTGVVNVEQLVREAKGAKKIDAAIRAYEQAYKKRESGTQPE